MMTTLEQSDEPEKTFPTISHAVVVKRLTSYENKDAIRYALRHFDDRTIAYCLINFGDPGGQYWALDGVDPERKKHPMLPPFGWSEQAKRDQALEDSALKRWKRLLHEGEVYMQVGNTEDVASVLDGALHIAERAWDPNHRRIAQTCNNLGWLRMRQEEFQGALEFFKRLETIT